MVALAAPTAHSDQTPASTELVGPCGFSVAELSFRGAALEQAECLLRQVRNRGVIDARPARLPKVLRQRIGQPMRLDAAAIAREFEASGCGALADSLSRPVSRARDNDPSAPQLRYFVIHDTSSPYLKERPFPRPLDSDPVVNDVSPYLGANAVAHAFIDRRGAILWGHDFSTPWRATKLESRIVGIPAKGLFIHIENVEPRRRDPNGPSDNDWIAPRPGLTANQYDRLALLYLYASRRAGVWLIPAFHGDVDEGIPAAHDDPQNFELNAFARALRGRIQAIKAVERRQ